MSLVFLACSSENTNFAGTAQRPPVPAPQPGSENVEPPSPPPEPAQNNISESFSIQGKPPIADYLFILDNSSSMRNDIDAVRNALLAIPSTRYPENSRIGVMTSMVSKYENYAVPHAGINKYTGIETEPGFLDLVTATSIAAFVANPVVKLDYRNKYSLKGCSSDWFEVSAKDPDNALCLDGALQNSLHGVGCEAGMNALEQLFLKRKSAGKSVFRSGAYAHAIFISDEKHPGCNNAEIVSKIPSYAQLRHLAMQTSEVVGFKLHGIGVDPVIGPILEGDESKAGTYATSARRRVDDSAGVYLDLGVPDYQPVIEQILSSGSYEKALFSLRVKPQKIVSVKIDGVETTEYVVTADGNIEILQINVEEDHTVVIEYQEAP